MWKAPARASSGQQESLQVGMEEERWRGITDAAFSKKHSAMMIPRAGVGGETGHLFQTSIWKFWIILVHQTHPYSRENLKTQLISKIIGFCIIVWWAWSVSLPTPIMQINGNPLRLSLHSFLDSHFINLQALPMSWTFRISLPHKYSNLYF